MAVALIFAVPVFLAVIFLLATFYYRNKVIILQKRLQRMWVENMLNNKSPAQREDGMDLFFDGKGHQLELMRTTEDDTDTVK